METLQKHMYF